MKVLRKTGIRQFLELDVYRSKRIDTDFWISVIVSALVILLVVSFFALLITGNAQITY